MKPSAGARHPPRLHHRHGPRPDLTGRPPNLLAAVSDLAERISGRSGAGLRGSRCSSRGYLGVTRFALRCCRHPGLQLEPRRRGLDP
ncbi:hypothetical protein ACRAWF_03145 [Streptomyces sp. L7]